MGRGVGAEIDQGLAFGLDRRVIVNPVLSAGWRSSAWEASLALPRPGSRHVEIRDDIGESKRRVAEPEVSMRQFSGFVVRVDCDIGDFRGSENPFKELPAGLVARFGEEISAFKANVTLAGKADRDVHGYP